jgi:hypothetical protein
MIQKRISVKESGKNGKKNYALKDGCQDQAFLDPAKIYLYVFFSKPFPLA